MREILCFGDSNTYGYIPGHYEKAPARYRGESAGPVC